MRRLIPLLFLLLPATRLPAAEYPLQQVEDGDTLVLEIGGQPLRLQLLGIDAPESVQNPKLKVDLKRTGLQPESLLRLGREATRHLARLIRAGQPVRVEGDLQQRDKYGRIPVVAYAPDGRNLNEAMVADGYAIPLKRQSPDNAMKAELQRLAASARKQRRGLWASAPEAMAAWSGIRP